MAQLPCWLLNVFRLAGDCQTDCIRGLRGRQAAPTAGLLGRGEWDLAFGAFLLTFVNIVGFLRRAAESLVILVVLAVRFVKVEVITPDGPLFVPDELSQAGG